jgi:hypothetical protein
LPKSADELERRHFRRVDAPITVRPVSLLAHAVPLRVNDVSLGGLRAYSDERYRVGVRLELELSFPGGESATMLAEVVWVDELSPGAPARYEVGLRYVDATPDDLILLLQVVGAAPP